MNLGGDTSTFAHALFVDDGTGPQRLLGEGDAFDGKTIAGATLEPLRLRRRRGTRRRHLYRRDERHLPRAGPRADGGAGDRAVPGPACSPCVGVGDAPKFCGVNPPYRSTRPLRVPAHPRRGHLLLRRPRRRTLRRLRAERPGAPPLRPHRPARRARRASPATARPSPRRPASSTSCASSSTPTNSPASILIQHQDCAFYKVRLEVREQSVEQLQRADLARAAHTIRRVTGLEQIEGYLARFGTDAVEFEQVDLA